MHEPIYYEDHAERYAHMSELERLQYPDELYVPSWGIIKREKNLADMTHEDYLRYGPDMIRFAAKDVPLSRAEIYH